MAMLYSHPGQMTWKRSGTDDCSLHLRKHPTDQWRHYREFPEYVLPDPPHFSEGYATFLELLKRKWQVMPA